MKNNRLYLLLQKIRERPALYLGDNDIRLLYVYICGFDAATDGRETRFLYGFNEFCEQKFNDHRTLNWASFIAEHTSKENGITTFFNLLDEFLEDGTMDEIMAMLDGDSPLVVQQRGIEKARSKPVCLFLMPSGGSFCWENCAMVVCEREDKELERYLDHLLLWAEDESKPGSNTIYKRLQQFQWNQSSLLRLRHYISYAKMEEQSNRLSKLLEWTVAEKY